MSNTTPGSLAKSRKARVARLLRDEDEVRTVSQARQIEAHYRKRMGGKRLAVQLVRHARTLMANDPAVAVELIERANAIEWEAKQAC